MYAAEGGLKAISAEAAVVRRIFAEFVAGKSQRQITRDLNRDGIRSQRDGGGGRGAARREAR